MGSKGGRIFLGGQYSRGSFPREKIFRGRMGNFLGGQLSGGSFPWGNFRGLVIRGGGVLTELLGCITNFIYTKRGKFLLRINCFKLVFKLAQTDEVEMLL